MTASSLTTYRMDLAYDGTRYSGWQRLGGEAETLQGRIEAVLTRLLEEPVEIHGSGRTDAGVHARGQVASFQTSRTVPADKLMAQMNHYLPGDITVLRMSIADSRFHARYHAVRKTYRYQIWNAALPNPLERRYRCHVAEPLDLAAMRQGAEALLGTHDFSAFTTMKSKKKSAVRTLEALTIRSDGPTMALTFVGDGFLHHMVRIITGTLLEIGAGRLSATEIPRILESKERAQAGPASPPQGLFLWAVDYSDAPGKSPEGWQSLTVVPGKKG